MLLIHHIHDKNVEKCKQVLIQIFSSFIKTFELVKEEKNVKILEKIVIL